MTFDLLCVPQRKESVGRMWIVSNAYCRGHRTARAGLPPARMFPGYLPAVDFKAQGDAS